MQEANLFYENTQAYLKDKAERALKKAKEIEAKKFKEGKRYVKINDKITVLK
jgi:hypothetical protein